MDVTVSTGPVSRVVAGLESSVEVGTVQVGSATDRQEWIAEYRCVW